MQSEKKIRSFNPLSWISVLIKIIHTNLHQVHQVIHLTWVSVAHDIIKCTLGTLVNTLYTVPVIHKVLSAYTRILQNNLEKIKVHIKDQCNKTNTCDG